LPHLVLRSRPRLAILEIEQVAVSLAVFERSK
jgi:hypothetical protein